MNPSRTSERGQALVLIVLAIVAVFGFSALAIDGGMLYAERRRAQNAADTAVFAAAMASFDEDGDYQQAGYDQAALNGFIDDIAVGGTTDVTVITPPSSGVYAGKDSYYQVIIKTEFSPFFAQFVYSGKLQNTVEAVARAKPSTSLSPGNAVHATSPDQCNALWFTGAAGTLITDANIYSNSSRTGNTANGDPAGCFSGLKSGAGNLKIENGTIITTGTFDTSGSGEVQLDTGETILQGPENKVDIVLLDGPVCGNSTHPEESYTKGQFEVSPGVYALQPGVYPNGIRLQSDDIVTLASGIYCLDDDLTGGAHGSITGEGVMIYMRGNTTHPNPSINLLGGVTVVLKSVTEEQVYDYASPPAPWSGMVIFMDKKNGGTVEIAGNAYSALYGTIYAPGPILVGGGAKAAKCDLQGNSESFDFRAQVICYSVGVTGSVELEIHYKETEQFHVPPMVELSQ